MENYQKLHTSLLIMLKDLDNQLADIIQKPVITENLNNPKNLLLKDKQPDKLRVGN
ncbi:MAG: hypothetical protein KAG06_08275 [Methylococcales bacterium]|nr:hypothetical protein [Methylococcales bacterium]